MACLELEGIGWVSGQAAVHEPLKLYWLRDNGSRIPAGMARHMGFALELNEVLAPLSMSRPGWTGSGCTQSQCEDGGWLGCKGTRRRPSLPSTPEF